MLPTTRARVQITLSPREVERWPDTAARALAHDWPKGRPASFSVPTLERVVPICRHLAGSWMDSQDITDEGVRYAVSLVLSELMTNAILHTNSVWITGHLRKTGDRLLVEVHDEGGASVAAHPHRARHANEHGRGLALVAQSVQELGMRLEADGGRTVWACVQVTAQAPRQRTASTSR
ncbi:ATP-binding protein [Streptomyces sp. NPDC006923]|uniref:ATP-binding protein n=1 Tax=Streptomyces sp. NPDC006923 TaxID=3155355 RepID=UPI0033C96E2F